MLSNLEEFVADHRPHGVLTGDATEPAWNGLLTVVMVKRFVEHLGRLDPEIKGFW